MSDEEIYRDNWELKIFESAEFLIVPYNYLREDFFMGGCLLFPCNYVI